MGSFLPRQAWDKRERETTDILNGVLCVVAEKRCMHIFQPDVAWCGGLTQLVEIFRLGRVHGVPVYPHRGAA
eukprot:COSAG06_NODE_494_length_15057_cov_7.707782_22_plen_72_part_00